MIVYAFAFQSIDEEVGGVGGSEWHPDWDTLLTRFWRLAGESSYDTEYLFAALEVPEVFVPKDILSATVEEREDITDWVDATLNDMPVAYSTRIVVPGSSPPYADEFARIKRELNPPGDTDVPPPIRAPRMDDTDLRLRP